MTKEEFKQHSWRNGDKVMTYDETTYSVIAVHLGMCTVKVGVDGGDPMWIQHEDILQHLRGGKVQTSDEYKGFKDTIARKNDEIETLFQENADLRKQIKRLKNAESFRALQKQYSDRLDAIQRMLSNIECCFKSKTFELTDLKKFLDNTISEDQLFNKR